MSQKTFTMKRIITIALTPLLFLLSYAVYGQEPTAKPMTFTDAYEQMHHNSQVFKQAGYAILEKEAEKKATNRLRLPPIFISTQVLCAKNHRGQVDILNGKQTDIAVFADGSYFLI